MAQFDGEQLSFDVQNLQTEHLNSPTLIRAFELLSDTADIHGIQALMVDSYNCAVQLAHDQNPVNHFGQRRAIFDQEHMDHPDIELFDNLAHFSYSTGLQDAGVNEIIQKGPSQKKTEEDLLMDMTQHWLHQHPEIAGADNGNSLQ